MLLFIYIQQTEWAGRSAVYQMSLGFSQSFENFRETEVTDGQQLLDLEYEVHHTQRGFIRDLIWIELQLGQLLTILKIHLDQAVSGLAGK